MRTARNIFLGLAALALVMLPLASGMTVSWEKCDRWELPVSAGAILSVFFWPLVGLISLVVAVVWPRQRLLDRLVFGAAAVVCAVLWAVVLFQPVLEWDWVCNAS